MTTIIEAKVTSFVWKNIICRFEVLRDIILDNGKQFDNPKFQNFCQDLGVENHYSSLRHPRANYHAPNPIPEFVTMTGMLISSLNLILTRTNLIFTKLLRKLFSFFKFLFLYLNDITFHFIFRASTLYSKE